MVRDLDAARARHKPATARNVALVIQTQLDQMMAEARDAGLWKVYRKMDEAFQETVEAIKEMDGE